VTEGDGSGNRSSDRVLHWSSVRALHRHTVHALHHQTRRGTHNPKPTHKFRIREGGIKLRDTGRSREMREMLHAQISVRKLIHLRSVKVGDNRVEGKAASKLRLYLSPLIQGTVNSLVTIVVSLAILLATALDQRPVSYVEFLGTI
jgi:hypothetical protein